MQFVKLKWKEKGNQSFTEVIINTSKIKDIKKYYPDKLNPNNPYVILINTNYRVEFSNKKDADHYFNYIMEKLRALELKNTPW